MKGNFKRLIRSKQRVKKLKLKMKGKKWRDNLRNRSCELKEIRWMLVREWGNWHADCGVVTVNVDDRGKKLQAPSSNRYALNGDR